VSGGTAGIAHPGQHGSNDKGKTANPPATPGTGAVPAAACAPVSDVTGVIHGHDSDTSASGSPAPPRPLSSRR
jgi:hypothetical protein